MKRLLLLLLLLIPTLGWAQSWSNWVYNLRQEAISKGISATTFEQAFYNLTPNPRLLHFDRKQPEKRLTFLKYRSTRADNYRITIGRRELKRYANLLNRVAQVYGVSPCFITAIWGLESSYGRFVGNFDTIRSLATLAYDGRRSAFFRNQLLLALRMLDEGQVTREEFKGEWAGASGQCQFLPSSWYKYAVDFSGDGYKDIWRNHADIFASIANYLHTNGWEYRQPILRVVELPPHLNRSLLTLKYTATVGEWLQHGVRFASKQYRPANKLQASVIEPYGGPALMVFNNFKVLMTWNYSSYYAGTVTYMAQEICH